MNLIVSRRLKRFVTSRDLLPLNTSGMTKYSGAMTSRKTEEREAEFNRAVCAVNQSTHTLIQTLFVLSYCLDGI